MMETQPLYRQSAPLEGSASAAQSIASVSYTHDAMIDLVLANPKISQNEIAKHFGYRPAWISRVFNSDAFLARLAQRKSDLVDPAIFLNIDEKLRTIASKSLDIVLEKLELAPSMDDALRAAELGTKALGYGARNNNAVIQQNFVIAMPAKVENASDWAAKHSGTSPQLRAMAEAAKASAVDATEVQGTAQ